MAQEFKPGEIVPQSGIYTITHDAAHKWQRASVPGRLASGRLYRPVACLSSS